MATVVLAGLLYVTCEMYLDDCIVFGKGPDEFLQRLRDVFIRFRKKNLFLKAKKCKFGVSRLEYVGRVISKEGLSMSAEKIKSVLEFPCPKTVTVMRGFLGLANYFRSFVPDHSKIVAPLHKMTVSTTRNPETIKPFQDIRQAISQCPLMHFIDNVSPIHLYTDASDYGVGGVLSQKVGDEMKPISFVSNSLNFSQLNWSTIQKEAYAIFLCCTKLDPFLRDRKFTIHIDPTNLTYMKSSPNSMVGRWSITLQEHSIAYVRGSENTVADAISRLCANLSDLVI